MTAPHAVSTRDPAGAAGSRAGYTTVSREAQCRPWGRRMFSGPLHGEAALRLPHVSVVNNTSEWSIA